MPPLQSKIPKAPTHKFEPRPFISQTKVAFETPSTIVYDTKFDTALRASHMQQHFTRMSANKPRSDDLLVSKLRNYPAVENDSESASKTFSHLMLKTTEKMHEFGGMQYVNSHTSKTTNRTFKLVQKNIMLQTQYLNSYNFLLTNKVTMKELDMMFKTEINDLSYISQLLDFANWWLGVINASNTMYSAYYSNMSQEDRIPLLVRVNRADYPPLGLEVDWSHNFCIFKFAGETHLLPKSYLLLMHNKICDILSVLVYAKYARHSSLPKSAYVTTINFLEELWTLNMEYGQSFFTIAKCLEALASAETLAEVEQWDNKDFLRNIINDLAKDIGFNYMTSSIRSMLRNATSAFRHELACLSKLGGHPFVDMKDGSEKIHKYTTEAYELNYDKINECLCYAKQNYIRNYIVRENRWPPSQINSPSAPRTLVKAHIMNRDPEAFDLSHTYGRISITDYNYIDLLPEMKFNMLENAIPHLKDKTISLTRTAVINHYINHEKDSRVSWRDTRLLLYYLLRDEDESDHVSFIKEYSRSRDFDDLLDYLIIRIVPKEKELKVAYRGFGCTTYHNRMLFLSQEKNAMHYLDMYCDEQAMTLSEIDLVRRLYAFRCLKHAYPRHRVYYATIDASKWNNHFRPETCDYIMKELLDKIFNVNIFGKTQSKFESTFFYVPDGDETYHWEGQSGGIEGLNQDTWVITYIAQIKTSLSGMNVKYHLLCKGDDLRLAILIPESDVRAAEMKKTGLTIMQKLSEAAKGVGHDIKVYDSYGSERYFNFSKNASIDKVELPQAYRKVQKCYGATNAFLPTYDEYIASTYSNAHSACRVTTNVIPAYCVALFWANYYLLSDTRPSHVNLGESKIDYDGFDKNIYYADRSDDELVALLLCPGLAGGFPIIYLHNMMVRAESDLLPAFLDIVKFCKKAYPSIYKHLLQFLYYDTGKKKTWKPVYSDPYCLPLKKPITAAQKLKSFISPALLKLARNTEILDLLDLVNDDTASAKCIKSMDSSPILHAKIFSVLFSAFPQSILSEIVNKFENARSVMEILILRSGVQRSEVELRTVIRADIKVQRWRKNRLLGTHNVGVYSVKDLLDDCPAKAGYAIRKRVWGKPVDGITMPPVTHILSYMTQADAIHSEHARQNHFQYTVNIPTEFVSGHNNYHFGVGTLAPFLGKITSAATTRPMIQMVEKDVILSKLKTIAELSSWADRTSIDEEGNVSHSNIDVLISKLLKLFTDEPLTTFSPLAGSKLSGTTAHHVRTRQYRESIVPNSLSNIYQFVHGDTAQHRGFFSNRGHFWINFLHCFCQAVNMLTFELNVSPRFTTPEIVWVVTNKCDWCTRQIDEPAVIIDTKLLDHVRFPRLKITKLNQHTIKVLKQSLGLLNTRPINIDGYTAEITPQQATLGLFNNLVDTTIRRQNALTDRYTQHPDNPEGRKVLTHFVPQNFGKFLDIKDIFELDTSTLASCLVTCIFKLMTQRLNMRKISEFESLLLVMPSYTLPWYSLVEALHKSGKLAAVVKHMASEADVHLLGIMMTPEQVTPHLGLLSLKLIAFVEDSYPLVLLTNYQDADIRRVVLNHISLLIWKYYCTESNYFVTSEGAFVDKEASLKACSNVILLSLCNITSDENESLDINLVIDGEVKLEDITEFDLEALTERVDELDEDNAGEILYPYLQIISHLSPFSRKDIVGHMLSNIDGALSDAQTVYERMSFNVMSVTPLNCLETLRNQDANSDYAREMPDFRETVVDVLEQYFILPTQPIKDYITVLPPYEENPTCIPVPPNKYFEVYDRRNIGNEYMFRAFGNGNDTANRLNFIYHALKNPDYKGAISGISLHSMGDGIGNGTAFFLSHFKQMRIVYTTRPESKNEDTYPIICEDLITTTQSIIYHDHIQAGIYDLSKSYILDHLREQYHGQHIYFCDAEPTPGDLSIYDVYSNVVHYFLSTRSPNSILIMQCSIERSSDYMKLMTILQKYCLNTVVVLPPSLRCVYSHYFVAWGIRKHYNQDTPDHPNEIPSSILNAMEVVFSNARKYYEAKAKSSNMNVRLNITNYVFNARTNQHLSPLWATYCQRYMNRVIHNDEIALLKSELQSQDRKKSVIIRNCPRFSNSVMTYKKLLHGSDIDPISISQRFNMSYQAHRIHVVKNLMIVLGWESALTYYRNGHDVIPMKNIRQTFLNNCQELPVRDYNPEIKYTSMFGKAGMTHPTGAKMDYWAYFCRGFEFFMSYLAWCNIMAKVARDPRYFD